MANVRVLIVDDEPRNLSLLEALLSPTGVSVHRAGGGREGVEAYRAEARTGGFDLVLLDVMMPDVDGFTALAEMRRATADRERIPILLVTALHAREDRMRGLEAGADDFLTKPLDPNEVRCRVRTFLALRGAQRSLRARADELEALQKAKADLTRMIVHDLKNPLAGVGSNLSWIERRLKKLAMSDEPLLEALQDARAGSDRLLSLVSGLIEIEKAETGQLVIRKRKSVLAEVLEGVIRRHGREAVAKGITMDVEAAADLEGEIDPDLINRVLENLVENATRYTNQGGRIRLSAHKVGGSIEIAVANTGKAIPEAQRRRLFEKHESGEDRGVLNNNLGLGLYFCRLAARAHGGEIEVEETEAFSTRFFLRLPTGAPEAKRVASAFLD